MKRKKADLSGFGEKEASSVDFVTLVIKRILFFSFFNQLPSINKVNEVSFQYEI